MSAFNSLSRDHSDANIEAARQYLMLALFQLPLSGSQYVVKIDASEFQKAPFNSLSRDHA